MAIVPTCKIISILLIREGLPLNIVESMLSGNPVVASINRGHKELIHDGENGYLVSRNDSEMMADRVLELFADSYMSDNLSNNAYGFAMDYSFTSVKKELEVIYFN